MWECCLWVYIVKCSFWDRRVSALFTQNHQSNASGIVMNYFLLGVTKKYTALVLRKVFCVYMCNTFYFEEKPPKLITTKKGKLSKYTENPLWCESNYTRYLLEHILPWHTHQHTHTHIQTHKVKSITSTLLQWIKNLSPHPFHSSTTNILFKLNKNQAQKRELLWSQTIALLNSFFKN